MSKTISSVNKTPNDDTESPYSSPYGSHRKGRWVNPLSYSDDEEGDGVIGAASLSSTKLYKNDAVYLQERVRNPRISAVLAPRSPKRIMDKVGYERPLDMGEFFGARGWPVMEEFPSGIQYAASGRFTPLKLVTPGA